MMQGLLNAMKLQAMLAGESKAHTRMATVSGYDPANYCAKVFIQPENIETGWLPVASLWVGNNFGMFAPPAEGDMVQIAFQEGDFNSGIVGMRLFNDQDRPLNVPGGEFWLVHSSGSSVKLTNDGKVSAVDKAGSSAVLDGTGKIVLTGGEIDLVGTGGTAKGIVQADCICAWNGQPHPMVSAKVKGSL